jgi:hypothetical protein
MSSKQLLSMPEQGVNFIQDMQKTLEGMPTLGEKHDYAANLLWQDENEFQEVLKCWSSQLRAIHKAKLLKPIQTEFKLSWDK